jgi:hypothetical protein
VWKPWRGIPKLRLDQLSYTQPDDISWRCLSGVIGTGTNFRNAESVAWSR